MIRAFFAITLDEEVKQGLLTEISHLKENFPVSIKWVKKHQLHLTLRFLGSVTGSQLDQIINTIVIDNLPSFNLEFQHLLAFPQHKPRIIGMSVRPNRELSLVVHYLRRVLMPVGFAPEDRAFLPHITLGRITKPRRKLIMLRPTVTANLQHVSQITLFESQLSPEGSKYSVLQLFPLKTTSGVPVI